MRKSADYIGRRAAGYPLNQVWRQVQLQEWLRDRSVGNSGRLFREAGGQLPMASDWRQVGPPEWRPEGIVGKPAAYREK